GVGYLKGTSDDSSQGPGGGTGKLHSCSSVLLRGVGHDSFHLPFVWCDSLCSGRVCRTNSTLSALPSSCHGLGLRGAPTEGPYAQRDPIAKANRIGKGASSASSGSRRVAGGSLLNCGRRKEPAAGAPGARRGCGPDRRCGACLRGVSRS